MVQWSLEKTYSKAAIVVYEIDKAVSSGRLARAKALRSVLNHQSVDRAFKLSEKPVAESDPILELIASGEVRTPKQAQLLLHNRQRLKERSAFGGSASLSRFAQKKRQSLVFTPAHSS